jgi:hypothetical protein
VFLYSFNSALESVRRYFGVFGSHVEVHDMSVPSVVNAIVRDGGAGLKVALVTPSSPNYQFGSVQLEVFSAFIFVCRGCVCVCRVSCACACVTLRVCVYVCMCACVCVRGNPVGVAECCT